MFGIPFKIVGGAIALGLGVVVFAACSDDANPTTTDESDAGIDANPPIDAGPPDVIEEPKPALDCVADRAVNPDGLAKHIGCAGLYSDVTTKTIATDARPFTPAVQFWSDGAEKRRWVQLPAGQKIDTTMFDEWLFPIGTRFWKEFKVDGKRIETRLYEKGAAGYKHTTYRWNPAETDATRKDMVSASSAELIPRPDNKPPYEVPSNENCGYCHAGRKEPVLGFEAVSLGLPPSAGTLEPGSVTLAVLVAEGLLTNPPASTTLALQEDATGKSAAAMAWMHANCGHCHNPEQGAGAGGSNLRLLLSASKLLEGAAAVTYPPYATGVCKPSERDAPAGGKYLFIAGSNPTASLAAILLGNRAPAGMESIVTQMPPIVSHTVDTAGAKLVTDWITALPPCP